MIDRFLHEQRRAARLHLLNYRLMAERGALNDPWVIGITAAIVYGRSRCPDLYTCADRVLGLTSPRRGTYRSRLLRAAIDCNRSESAIHRMVDQFVWLVLLYCVRSGALELPAEPTAAAPDAPREHWPETPDHDHAVYHAGYSCGYAAGRARHRAAAPDSLRSGVAASTQPNGRAARGG